VQHPRDLIRRAFPISKRAALDRGHQELDRARFCGHSSQP
jgi:hypothetical protein